MKTMRRVFASPVTAAVFYWLGMFAVSGVLAIIFGGAPSSSQVTDRALLPPAQFDRDFPGRVVVKPLTHYQALIECGARGQRGVDACSWVHGGVCYVVMSSEYPGHMLVTIFKNMRARCMGWRGY